MHEHPVIALSLDSAIIKIGAWLLGGCFVAFATYLGWLGMTMVDLRASVGVIARMSDDVDSLQRDVAGNRARIEIIERRLDRSVAIGRVPGVEQ